MKKGSLYVMVVGLILLNACGVSRKSGLTEESGTDIGNMITDKKWKLIELDGKPVPNKVNDREPFLLLQKSDRRFSANAGCNGLGGTFSLSGNKRIHFTQGMSTMMACENMEIERGLAKVLEAADHYTLNDDNELSLNKGRMAPLARFRVMASNTELMTLNGTWELNYISGPRIAFEGLYPRKKPTITFNLPETKAYGNSGCNNYNTTFRISGDSIKFENPISTKMACEGIGEVTFFRTIETITNYHINGNTLELIMKDVPMMRFEKTTK